jgi:CRP/FNR family cyclic AMP-dependent transcriptional regulator
MAKMNRSQFSVAGNNFNGSGAGWPQLGRTGHRTLGTAGTHRRWARGDILIREAEVTCEVVLIKRGRVKISSASPCGKQVIMAIRGPGDLLGESAAIDGKGRSATVTALTDVDAVSLTRTEFTQLLRNAPEVTFDLLVMLTGRLREATRQRLELSVYDVPTRTARWLLDAAAHSEPIGNGPGYTIRLTQTDLADAVGASRVSVANALRLWRKENTIATNRAVFRVLKPERLRVWACSSKPDPNR